MSKIDLKLNNDAGYYDISFGSDGDFSMVEGFDTTIMMSILCERRAPSSIVGDPLLRRGWIGNVLRSDGFEIGSLLWLYYQSRITNDALNGVKDAALNGMQWFLDDGFLKSVTAEVVKSGNSAVLQMTATAIDGTTQQKLFNIWENTGR